MRVQTHQPSRRGRPGKRNAHRITARVGRRSGREERLNPFDGFSDRVDDSADDEQIIRDFVSVHDAVVAADEYDS